MIAGARHLASVITWTPLVAATTATIAWLELTARPSGLLLSTAAAGVAATAAHLLDDPAAVTLQSSPTTLLRRRAHRVTLAVPLIAAWWVIAGAIVSRSTANLSLAAHTLQLIAMCVVGLAGAATAARVVGAGSRGGTAGALAVIVCFGTAFLPAPSLQLLQTDPAGPGAVRRLAVVLAVALGIQLGSSIDPARRVLGRRVRASGSPTTILLDNVKNSCDCE
jgi:hypothetical protein